MANNCNCSITFRGNDMGKIKTMIAEAIEVNNTKYEGWLPNTMDKSNLDYEHYLFDVEIISETEDELQIQCWTKWSPPTKELEQICSEANVSCTCWYDEPGMGIYGQSFYDVSTGYTTDISLDETELGRVIYDDETEQYLYDGKPIESDYVAYLEMLDDKILNANIGF